MNTKKFIEGIFVLLLLSVCHHGFGQNNPIFGGGSGDGTTKVAVSQSGNNIFSGSTGDGTASGSFAQNGNGIFKGSAGDGWNTNNHAQNGNNIFTGGAGDGWNTINKLQNGDNIFTGGSGDGWNTQNKMPVLVDSIFKGSTGDGESSVQTSRPDIDNLFKGGDGDGWASTYRPQGPIPVNFIYFNAKKSGTTTSLLNWKTSQEINSAYFDVERSEDAIHYYYIGRLNAAGNSSVPVEYFFTDNNPVNGINYYRLRQVDRDGHYIYTPTRQVRFEGLDAGTVKYFPNPTNGKIYIEIPESMREERKVINITNTAGVVMDQQKTGSWITLRLEVDLGKYAKGIYFIQVKTATTNSVQRVVLQ